MSIDWNYKRFFYYCAAHLPVRLDIETKFPYFLFLSAQCGQNLSMWTKPFQPSQLGIRVNRRGPYR